MKRLISILICCVLLLFSGCEKKGEPFEVNPPFYKVENAQTGAVVYMLGSMHVGKPEAVYPEAIYNAINECDTLAVEVDIQALEEDMPAAAEAVAVLQCPFGTTVRDYMGDDYDRIVKLFTEKGIYNYTYEYYVPAMWSSIWTSKSAEDSGYDGNCGTDLVMLTYAKEHGKIIDEIETAKEQYQVNAGMSIELQMLMLNQTLELSDDMTKMQFDILYNAWRTGDIETLKALAEEEDSTELSPQLKTEYESYYDAMYTARQRKMADYVEAKLKSGGKTFVIVGAMHYAAPPSIIDNLENDGYTVVTLSK